LIKKTLVYLAKFCGKYGLNSLSTTFQLLLIMEQFRVNSQKVVKAPSPIFLKFYSNCHCPIR